MQLKTLCRYGMLGSHQKAFTLIELMIVCATIAILAAVAVPQYFRNVDMANYSKIAADLKTLDEGIIVYVMNKAVVPETLDDLVTSGVLARIPTPPDFYAKHNSGTRNKVRDAGYGLSADGVRATLDEKTVEEL